MCALDDSVYSSPCSPLAPVVSLQALAAGVFEDEEASAFDIPASFTPPEECLDSAKVIASVRAFVNALPPRKREIVMRAFWDGESQASIARDLGVSGAAISNVIRKILDQGRKTLAPYQHCSPLVEVA